MKTAVERAAQMPAPEPGQIVIVPLNEVGAEYLRMYALEPIQYFYHPGVRDEVMLMEKGASQ